MAGKIEIKFNGNTVNLSNTPHLFLISGPCVIENEKLTLSIANKIKDISLKLQIPFIFKASYKKANRTSGKSFRSIGVQKSLDILAKIRENLQVPVLTDVHSELEASIAADYVDVLQIPAFLSRQTELLEAAGETGRIVNIKKGQFLSPEDIEFQIKKVEATGNKKIIVTERGSSFGYHNLVVDMRSLAIMKKFKYPVVFDATHSLQMPSSVNGVSGGSPEFIYPMARSAAAMGINGIFIETHPNPAKALSDSKSMLPLNRLEGLLKQIIEIHNLVAKFND
ncbi:MAG: 3-deoxy-8-phosphooctulonate synthase [Ignavibacteriae bacterium]|nr:MAG: 3-deoxy-8-phosphooctulonate synthase [Ignavibacteriota bacterium]